MKTHSLLLAALCLSMSLLVGCGGSKTDGGTTAEAEKAAEPAKERYIGYWGIDPSLIDNVIAEMGEESPIGKAILEPMFKDMVNKMVVEITAKEFIGYTDGEADPLSYTISADGDSKYNVVMDPDKDPKNGVLTFIDKDHMMMAADNPNGGPPMPMPLVRLTKADFDQRNADAKAEKAAPTP